MKERPIIFNDEMVRAILSGTKTMTRRPVKPQPADDIRLYQLPNPEHIGYVSSIKHKFGSRTTHLCPYGQPGDRLWVRETFGDCGVRFVYRADTDDGTACQVKRWTPSIHMPRWASRITLEITGVRVERLQDITEDDARAEGISPAGELLPEYPDAYLTPRGGLSTVRVAFRRLWKSIYGDTGWNSNPWVWVIAFRRVDTGCATGASKGE
ncbi:hypothetical protein ACSYAE_09085 [Edwardsiella tarda]|uniref:hypothetical protein n=1 Tax=Edwardsiella tarda TaxID=636 RepID=UPI003F65C0BA